MIIWCGFFCFCNCVKDLIWGSVKYYCGIVLDREIRIFFGIVVFFVFFDFLMLGCFIFFKFVWVICVKVVEGCIEVFIKISKGGIYVV